MNYMKLRSKIFTITLCFVLIGCNVKSKKPIFQNIPEDQLYEQGIKEINAQHYKNATKTFTKFEEEYPLSKHYANTLILKEYSLYSENK